MKHDRPCPICSKRLSLMAGALVPQGDCREQYWVCWNCAHKAVAKEHLEWQPFFTKPQPRKESK
jgi:hypothetical protein